MGENQDISKIIGIIMENPDIIARIKGLADKQNDSALSNTEETASIQANAPEIHEQSASVRSSASNGATKTQCKRKQRELLLALKPYVKNERAQAIDTMLSVIDVITAIRGKSS